MLGYLRACTKKKKTTYQEELGSSRLVYIHHLAGSSFDLVAGFYKGALLRDGIQSS
jgi:hypothetical protein